jgi:hypothetical protein
VEVYVPTTLLPLPESVQAFLGSDRRATLRLDHHTGALLEMVMPDWSPESSAFIRMQFEYQ